MFFLRNTTHADITIISHRFHCRTIRHAWFLPLSTAMNRANTVPSLCRPTPSFRFHLVLFARHPYRAAEWGYESSVEKKKKWNDDTTAEMVFEPKIFQVSLVRFKNPITFIGSKVHLLRWPSPFASVADWNRPFAIRMKQWKTSPEMK